MAAERHFTAWALLADHCVEKLQRCARLHRQPAKPPRALARNACPTVSLPRLGQHTPMRSTRAPSVSLKDHGQARPDAAL